MSYLKHRFSKIIFSFLLTISVIYLSTQNNVWVNFWGFLNIPASDPFSDFKALNIFLSYKENGFNPYFQNPNSDPIHNVLIYPSIWLYVADFLNLKNNYNFYAVCFCILFTYFFVLIDLTLRIKNRYFQYLTIIFFFSTSNFLIIERLNIELFVFCLIYFTLINRVFFKQFIFYALSLILKIFPLFSIFIFIEKKKNFLIVLIFSIIYLFIMREEIALIKNNVIEYALIFAYGSLSISKAIYFYSTKFNLFINEENYFIFKNLLSFGIGLIATVVALLNFKFGKKTTVTEVTMDEKMFLCGAGIYIGTFITSSNIDYRLIFLLLTLPYLLTECKKNLSILYSLCLLICFNSLLFEGGDSYSFFYFLKASIIYLLKFIIFFINCYYFGKVCNRFIYLGPILNFQNK